jgi:hypothetical protein
MLIVQTRGRGITHVDVNYVKECGIGKRIFSSQTPRVTRAHDVLNARNNSLSQGVHPALTS